jgi:hypothetical protein
MRFTVGLYTRRPFWLKPAMLAQARPCWLKIHRQFRFKPLWLVSLYGIVGVPWCFTIQCRRCHQHGRRVVDGIHDMGVEDGELIELYLGEAMTSKCFRARRGQHCESIVMELACCAIHTGRKMQNLQRSRALTAEALFNPLQSSLTWNRAPLWLT